jgi:superfamily II DNA or RNA helicase
VRSPLVWIARLEGYLPTRQGVRRVGRCVGPAVGHRDLLPVAEVPEHVATMLKLPATPQAVPQAIWRELLDAAAVSENDEFPGRAYALFAESGQDWPDGMSVRCRVADGWSNEIADSDIAVTAVRDEYDELVREGIPALLVPTRGAAEMFAESWGMRTPLDVIKRELRFVPESEPVPLLEVFPQLRLRGAAVQGLSLTRCSELEEITRTPTGMRTRTLERAVQDHSVLVLRPPDDLAALAEVDAALRLGLGPEGCREVLEHRRRQREDARIRDVRLAATNEAKILALIGEERLRAGLPTGLEEFERSRTGEAPTGERVARLALNTHGESILRHHARDVVARHEAAPHTFTGTNASRRFVTELGFPESFAGAASVARPEVEEVDGPSDLPRLHGYQETVAARMVELLSQKDPGRAMLRLPTGAGKTRVAVEAITRLAHRQEIVGPILWIAQSDELCEQAVESWRYLWGKVGPERTLTINRFWGGNDATPVSDTVQLVVATDAKLRSRLGDDAYGWLREAALVVIDEAHRAIPRMYTEILEKLGLTHRRTARPLVGLTATPYRGLNEEETRRLVERFGRRRLDDDLFGEEDPYVALQGLSVLAKVDHRELPGSTLTLTAAEHAEVKKYRVLPSSAEEQLARNVDRNQTIVGEIARLPRDWPVLVFATSVDHSKLLTAMLNDIGVPSTSIDTYTPMSERRRRIQEYREGRRRVITNYGVLAQGFDAPRTRAVVIARPTYSPNVYQQMIGRGLRGPLNGGEDTCLILDVHDNIENYGEKLAFTGFEHLWTRR